jgi:hypothetical protein
MIKNNEVLSSIDIDRMFDQNYMVFFDDHEMRCTPMFWSKEFRGIICSNMHGKGGVAIFANWKAARKAINLSSEWNAILKAQGKMYDEHFEDENLKYLKILPCCI